MKTVVSTHQLLQAIAATTPAPGTEGRQPTIRVLKAELNKGQPAGKTVVNWSDIMAARTPAITEGLIQKIGYEHNLTEDGVRKLAEYNQRRPATQQEPIPV